MIDSNDDIIGTKPTADAQVSNLPLFAAEIPLIKRMVMPGHGTRARREAREKVEPHLVGMRGRVYRTLLKDGPMDRYQLHQATGLGENTINGRVSELIKMGKVRVSRFDEAAGRGVVEAVDE